MPKRETEDKGLCRQEQYNKVAVIDRNFLLFSELDKLDENVEKAVDNLKQAMAVVARIKIRLQKHIEKHDQYKSFYRYKTLTKSRTEIYHWIFLSHHELTIYFLVKIFFLYIFQQKQISKHLLLAVGHSRQHSDEDEDLAKGSWWRERFQRVQTNDPKEITRGQNQSEHPEARIKEC